MLSVKWDTVEVFLKGFIGYFLSINNSSAIINSFNTIFFITNKQGLSLMFKQRLIAVNNKTLLLFVELHGVFVPDFILITGCHCIRQDQGGFRMHTINIYEPPSGDTHDKTLSSPSWKCIHRSHKLTKDNRFLSSPNGQFAKLLPPYFLRYPLLISNWPPAFRFSHNRKASAPFNHTN